MATAWPPGRSGAPGSAGYVAWGKCVARWDTGGVGNDRVDLFVSHAGSDRAWAEWAAWQLTEAGYTVELDLWDWAAGENFVLAMSDALDHCDRVIALFSPAYFDRSRYTVAEFTASFIDVPGMGPNIDVPGMGTNRLIPVFVEKVPATGIPALLRPLAARNLFGLGEEQARQALLEAVAGPRRPDGKPEFPGQGTPGTLSRLGGTRPRMPGHYPRVWNIPAHNPAFTGREGLLVEVRRRLVSGDRAVVQALYGMSGVGKTQLATEYAHRFAGTYDLAWWVAAEQPALIAEQFAALGAALGCAAPGAGSDAVRSTVLGELRERSRWLLVFDNAEEPRDLRAWLPVGNGHVLITSREHEHRWTELATPVPVDVLSRAESVAILLKRVKGLSEDDAGRLADQLGYLPLALAQAAAYMAETATPATEYLRLLKTRASRLLDQGQLVAYQRSLAAATQLIADQLAGEDPAAAELASVCAFMAPDPVPLDMITGATAGLPPALAQRAADPLDWQKTLGRLTRQALVRLDERGLLMHRLTQAILRDRLGPGEAGRIRGHAEAILVNGNPGDPANPATWQRWAQLLPHLLARDLGTTANPELRTTACDACWYLLARGDADNALTLTGDLHQQWSRTPGGEDHPHTLRMASYRAWALVARGDYGLARDLDTDTLERQWRLFGPNDPGALTTASNLMATLGELGDLAAARELGEDTLERRRAVHGENHVLTLVSASNLADTLAALGELDAAQELAEDTLARRREVLGENHLSTLVSATNLASILREQGELRDAKVQGAAALARMRRVLGEEHPHTLASAAGLAATLRALGEYTAARDLDSGTLERRRRVLGEDHPATLSSADDLDTDLRALGETTGDDD
jgi:TIR domain-containing protein/tetratricopeptide repeat protein/NB-ARC domain-containing protein